MPAFASSIGKAGGVACMTLLVACTLLAKADGLVGPTPAAPGAADAAPVNDASGSDTSNPPVEAASERCEQNATAFCDDFDTAELGARWDVVEQAAGSLSLDNAVSVSPPRSLLAVAAPDAAAFTASRLMKRFQPAKRVRLEADVRLDAKDQTSAVDFLALTLMPPPDGYQFFGISVGVVEGAVQFERCEDPIVGSSSCVPRKLSVALDVFHRIALELDVGVDGGPTKATVFVDGQVVEAASMSPITTLGEEAAVGITWNDGIDGVWRIRLDNARVTLE